MNHSDYKTLQSEVFQKVVNLLKQDVRVLGIVLSGSMAKDKNDAYSDIDVDCYLKEGMENAGKELHEKIAKILPVFSSLWLYGKYSLLLLENNIRLDVTFWTTKDMEKFDFVSEKIFYDPTGMVEKTLKNNPKKIAKHPKWNPDEFEYIDWLNWMFRQVDAWAHRGGLNGDKAFEKFNNAIDSLAQIRKALIEIKLWLYGEPEYLKKIDEYFVKRLSQTYPQLNKEEILRCNRLLLAEWEKMLIPYCEKREIEAPKNKLEMLKTMLDDLEKVETH